MARGRGQGEAEAPIEVARSFKVAHAQHEMIDAAGHHAALVAASM
jgi:hypothetical protein